MAIHYVVDPLDDARPECAMCIDRILEVHDYMKMPSWEEVAAAGGFRVADIKNMLFVMNVRSTYKDVQAMHSIGMLLVVQSSGWFNLKQHGAGPINVSEADLSSKTVGTLIAMMKNCTPEKRVFVVVYADGVVHTGYTTRRLAESVA